MPVFLAIGNTSVKIESHDGGMLSVPLLEGVERLSEALSGHSGEQAAAASVNTPAEDMVATACRKSGLKGPIYAGRDFGVGVEIRTADPGSVGIDRVLNVKGAFALSGAAVAVVDAGTAISISVGDDAGRFIGGGIMPGIELSLRALAANTALLPEIELRKPTAALGRNTVDAMLSGTLYGAVGAIKEILGHIEGETGLMPIVIVTGGDGEIIAHAAEGRWKCVPNLTLHGLRLAYDETR